MSHLEIWFLAVGLAMDCFAVSVATGITLKQTRWRIMLTMAIAFGLFQAGMPLIGWMGTILFSHLFEQIDHWIAFGILAFLGGRMMVESFKEEEERHMPDPTKLLVILTLAVATSIDALAVGVSFACLGISSWREILYPITAIGWVSFALSIVGLLIGIAFDRSFARKLKAERWGGLILILIGCKVLTEHLLG